LVSILVGCNGGNGVTPPLLLEAEKFVGTWLNEKPIGPGVNITKCEITLTGKSLLLINGLKLVELTRII
jgi:hypothetical protein